MPAPRLLIAVDSNVFIDEELGEADVIDALATIRKRIGQAQFIVTETVFQELAWIAENGDTQRQREAAEGALKNMLARGYTPVAMLPVDQGIATEIALKLRMRGIIPHEEEK